MDITAAVADLVGGMSDIQATANLYFETVHTWMPILSRKLFFSNLLHRLSHRRAESFLLILSMRLCSAQVTTPRTRLYRTVKQLYAEIEASGALSFQVLQASILIALYEMGHSVYPAAFLSVGLCARYATTLGINTNPASLHAKKLAWLEEEEHRRVWWSLAILDRFVLRTSKWSLARLFRCLHLPNSFSSRSTSNTLCRFLNICRPEHHLVTPNIRPDTYLPVDDEVWEVGVSCCQVSAATDAN